VQRLKTGGVKYTDKGVQKARFSRDNGFNYVRLRVFNDFLFNYLLVCSNKISGTSATCPVLTVPSHTVKL
jgi:arabinogalactan endo-1,4-beta-galactosidase